MQATSSIDISRPRLGRNWGWALAAGILFILVGILALLHPIVTTLAIAIYLGVTLLLAGVGGFLGGVMNLGERGSWLVLLAGVLGILAGLLLVFDPLGGAISLIWAVGAWTFVGGVFELIGAFSVPWGRGWLILMAIVDLALGVLIVTMSPASAIFFISFFVAASLLLRGLWAIAVAMRLRRLSRS